MELVRVRDINNPLVKVIQDDPVRPHIPLSQRVNEWAEILILKNDEQVLAAACMQWLKDVPQNEEDLTGDHGDHNVAVFYTVWSYSPGAGAEILIRAVKWLREEFKDISGIVTLSPQTEMARKFHLKNGARIRRHNATTTNYEYYFKEQELATHEVASLTNNV